MTDIEYIATDDREIERVSATCGHRKCPPGNCIAYSEKTLEITEADKAKAVELVKEGWWSTSAKRRTIARWREPVPAIEEMFRPDFLSTFHGVRLAKVVAGHLQKHYGCSGPEAEPHIEHAQLSPSLFRAFKQAGGDCAR